MNILVCGFGLMGKKVVQAVRDNKKMNLIGVVSPIFDETIKEIILMLLLIFLIQTI